MERTLLITAVKHTAGVSVAREDAELQSPLVLASEAGVSAAVLREVGRVGLVFKIYKHFSPTSRSG